MNLFQPSAKSNLLPFDGDVRFFGYCFTTEECQKHFECLRNEIDWKHDELLMFGKTIVTKRKVAWYGDPGLNYRYSNTIKIPLPWTQELRILKEKIEQLTAKTFNSCLLNMYHDGEEGMGWHSDDEPELGESPVIASLSFGSTRKFYFRHKSSKQQLSFMLEPGALFLMQGETQRYWQHQLPKMKKVKAPRINLTFRTIVK